MEGGILPICRRCHQQSNLAVKSAVGSGLSKDFQNADDRRDKNSVLSGFGASAFEFPEHAQQAVQNGEGMGRTSRNVEVDRDDAVGACVGFGVGMEWPAGYGACPDCDGNLGFGNCIPCFPKSELHSL